MNYGYDQYGKLTSVTRGSTVYGMTYDGWNQPEETKVGATALSTNAYDAYKRLSTVTYANGFRVRYEYDVLDRVTKIYEKQGTADEIPAYEFQYNNEGDLYAVRNRKTSRASFFEYDHAGRCMACTERAFTVSGGQVTLGAVLSGYRYEYDANNNLTKLVCNAAGSSWNTVYTYDKDNRPKTATFLSGKVLTNTYDGMGRVTRKRLGLNSNYDTNLAYVPGANGSQTPLLATYQNGSDDAYAYAYDDNGNITSITQGTTSVAYQYNGANELVRENNGFTDETVTYTYDLWGNLRSKKTYAYTEGDLSNLSYTEIVYGYTTTGDWKDQLVSYGAETISYDAMGNPTTYRGRSLTWRGKQLTGVSDTANNLSATYTYDSNGLRQQKTVNNVDTDYYYNGSVLIGLTRGDKTLRFSYDTSGKVSMVEYEKPNETAQYYYLRNSQGDIVKLIDATGAAVVEYFYDSWGKPLSCTGTLATSLGELNPFRYRGYVYDEETGFYYLKSRYYDPETCRFISSDVLLSTGQGVIGHNTYVYCLNNPVIMSDSFGRWAVMGDDPNEESRGMNDTAERALLLFIAQGLKEGSTGRLALEKAATLTSKKYIKAKENQYRCNQFVAEAFSGIEGYKIKDRSTTGIYEFFEGSIQSSKDATVAIDLSNAEIGAILFFSYPGCNDCDRCIAGRAQGMHIHHVGIYIGKINGIDYMVDNGTKTDVSIRPVSAVTPGDYGEYYCTAYMNPF